MPPLEAPFRLPDAPVERDLVAKYFRGLGEPTRLRILGLLGDEGELSVGELVERLGVPRKLCVFDGEMHAFHALIWRAAARDCWRSMFSFLGEHLPGGAPSAPRAFARRT